VIQGWLALALPRPDRRLSRPAAEAVLAATPGKAGLLHAAALTALGAGDARRAAGLLEQAVRLTPASAILRNDVGVAWLAVGLPSKAAAALRSGLELEPANAALLGNLGLALRALGDASGAGERLAEALAHEPAATTFAVARAELLAASGQLDEAEAMLRELTCGEGAAEARLALGRVLLAMRRWGDAEACFERVLAEAPGDIPALCGLAEVIDDTRLGELEARLRAATPAAAREQLDLERALARLARLRGDVTEEGRRLRRALVLSPGHVETRVDFAKHQLRQGDFAAGWPAFEWRWRQPDSALPSRGLDRPRWLGEPLGGAAILLHAEQGFGSVIQFARFAPMVAAAGGRVTLEVPRPLERLMRSLEGVAEVVAAGEPVPDVTWRCPLMSLPLAFGTELASIPAQVPYLAADAAEAAAWNRRLPSGALRVGLAWSGGPGHYNDRRRSAPIAALEPIWRTPGVALVSLQPRGEPPSPVADVAAELADFAATAALIQALDLVVAVDTAVAHLAGALGKPVWILLPFAAEYRWLAGRDDSPWYPTARLFRQPAPGDWAAVATRVAAELTALAG